MEAEGKTMRRLCGFHSELPSDLGLHFFARIGIGMSLCCRRGGDCRELPDSVSLAASFMQQIAEPKAPLTGIWEFDFWFWFGFVQLCCSTISSTPFLPPTDTTWRFCSGDLHRHRHRHLHLCEKWKALFGNSRWCPCPQFTQFYSPTSQKLKLQIS